MNMRPPPSQQNCFFFSFTPKPILAKLASFPPSLLPISGRESRYLRPPTLIRTHNTCAFETRRLASLPAAPVHPHPHPPPPLQARSALARTSWNAAAGTSEASRRQKAKEAPSLGKSSRCQNSALLDCVCCIIVYLSTVRSSQSGGNRARASGGGGKNRKKGRKN